MTTTANDITDAAYALCGIQNPSTDRDSAALVLLNDLIAQWSLRRNLLPYQTKENFSISQGTGSYSIGSGGDFDTDRPIEIDRAFVQDSGSLDYPVDVELTQDEYNEITDKSVQGRPDRLFYDPQYSLGMIYLDPVPDASYTLYLFSRKHLSSFSLISSTMSLPDEYALALKFNLAPVLAPTVNATLDQVTLNLASYFLSNITDSNREDTRWAKFDTGLTWSLWR